MLAKIIAESNETYPIGKNVAVVVKKKDSVDAFDNFEEGSTTPSPSISKPTEKEVQS